MLIKIDSDLYRTLEVQHVTPGNLRGFVRVKMRNIRNGVLADNRFRSEDTVERAVLDEREMQYLYQDGDDYYFMDTATFDQTHITSEALGDSVNYLKPEMTIQVEFYGTEPVGIELPQTVDLKVTEYRARHQRGDGEQPDQASHARDGRGRQRAALHQHGRRDSRQHGNRRILVTSLNRFLISDF
jgi:translation elongation factor P